MDTATVTYEVCHGVISVIGCGLNGLLIFMAIRHSAPAIRTYANLIVNFSLTDFLACLTNAIVEQRAIPVGWSLTFISNGPCIFLGATVCTVMYSMMLHFLTHSLWSLFISFGYRYYVLVRPAPSRRALLFVVAVVYSPSLLQCLTFPFAFAPPSEIEALLCEKMPTYNYTNRVVTGILDIRNPDAIICVLHMTVCVTPIYICMLVLRHKIVMTLDTVSSHLSVQTKSMHNQLLKALTYQAVIPGFYVLAVFAYTLPQLGIFSHPLLEYMVFSALLFVPVLTPVSSLFFVRHYRRRIASWFGVGGANIIPDGISVTKRTSQLPTAIPDLPGPTQNTV